MGVNILPGYTNSGINNGFMTIFFDGTIIGCSSEANICVLGNEFRKWSNNFDGDVFKDC